MIKRWKVLAFAGAVIAGVLFFGKQAQAHDNVITFPMCNLSTCDHIPAYIIRVETNTELILAWNPAVCNDCRIDWELVTASFAGVVTSGQAFEGENAVISSIDRPGLYELRYRQCVDISTTEVCGPYKFSRNEAAEAHGIMIEVRLQGLGGGGI